MEIKNQKEYLILNHKELIEELKDNQSFTEIARRIIEIDPILEHKNPERLRKIVSLVVNTLDDNIITNSTIQNEDGYESINSDSFKQYCLEEGIDITKVKSAKYVNHQGQQKYNVVLDFNSMSKKNYLDVRDEIIESMDSHSPKIYTNFKKKEQINGRLLILGLADLHLNQLSSPTETIQEYNTDIAIERAITGVRSLLKEAVGYNIETVLIPLAGDAMNIDTPSKTTTSGTPQDTDVMWYDSFILARELYVKIIDMCLTEGYKVILKHIVSNHDYMTGFMLSDTIGSWFRHSDIEFDLDMTHRKYYSYGKNLIGITHGDGAKKSSLPLLMANEAKDWSSSVYRYIFTQHIHHLTIAVDEIGVTVESLRTPTTSSGWAHRKGFQHSKCAIGAFIHDKEKGQIAKLIHNY